MAILDRGKGQRRQVVGISRHGAVLRTRETDAKFENAAYHGYVRPGGHAWACFRVEHPFEIAFEIATVFADGQVVVTRAAADDLLKHVVERHDRRVIEMTATLGPPRTVEAKVRSLAETLEAVFTQS